MVDVEQGSLRPFEEHGLAALEGLVLLIVLQLLARAFGALRAPGRITGMFVAGYGAARIFVEFFREPDRQLVAFAEATGLHMGQWLCVPMIAGGVYLVMTSTKRRTRVEPIAGVESVA